MGLGAIPGLLVAQGLRDRLPARSGPQTL